MADANHYTNSAGADNREQIKTWAQIGKVARKVVDHALMARAHRAAREAVDAYRAKHGDKSSFGYAYVYVDQKDAARLGEYYPDRNGYCLVSWGGAGALLNHEEVGARAFSDVLNAEGMKSFVESRMD